jgi:small subunit ribosomal protein S6
MAKYEVMFVTKSGLVDQDKEAILKQVTEVITKNEGKVNKKEVWMEKHRMAYAIKKQREGTYFLVEFNIPGAAIIKLNQAWKLNESMLRFQVIRLGE